VTGRAAVPADQATAAHSAAAAGPRDEYACARAWAALTAAHARIADRLAAELAGSCGMGISDFQILLRLESAPPPGLRLGELCPAARLTQPALSRAVARLGRRDWVSRTGASHDRRGVMVAISPAGLAILRQAVPVHARTIRELLLDPLTPTEQDLLARLLRRVAES
jgi:DNA-binding MarR family transcriptional regulator